MKLDILAFGAHPDDVELCCSGTLLKHIQQGKKVLVVNTASQCGFTPQYKELEELNKTYSGTNFVILGFPANNFAGQEPGTNKEIAEFCSRNYGVTFQMFEKISVKGNDMCELYKWLTKKELNGVADASIKWNFQKFLIDENGKWIATVSSLKSPQCEEIINWIKGTKK